MNSSPRRVVITGTGAICSLADSSARLYAELCSGTSGLRPVDLFSTPGMADVPVAGGVPFKLQDYLKGRNVRPLDRTARLVTIAAQQALDASGWTEELRDEHEVGLVLGTLFGSVHTISNFDRRALEAGPSYAKPLDFANSVINAPAGQTAIWHKLRGLNSTIAGGTSAGLQAIAYAADMIRSGRSTVVLAGGADELCYESLFGFYRTGRLAHSHNGTACSVPFEARRNGLTLGEGAALLMLESAESAESRGAQILAEVRGYGSGFDCSRGRDDAQAVEAIGRTIRLAFEDAGIGPEEIDGVSASANGSVAGDRHEAKALQAAFADRQRELPVTAIKSMVGESLGASGGLQAATMVEAMHGGILPGVRGFERLAEDCPLPTVSADNREVSLRHALAVAVGLDGNACAVILDHPEIAEAD